MSQTERLLIAAILLFAVIFSAGDLFGDYREKISTAHLLFEAGLLTVSLLGLGYLLRLWWLARKDMVSLRRDLLSSREDLKRFQAEARAYLKGLSQVIDGQFEQWNLTLAEKEVGLLMLKGLSFKEVAEVRATAERTVRQQAQSIYAKSGLSGRIEFAAFFLEDLLAPSQDTKLLVNREL